MCVALSRHANDIGADAVIALPPYVRKPNLDGIYAYYKAISDAIDISIFIQNAAPPLGAGLSASFVVKLAHEIEHAHASVRHGTHVLVRGSDSTKLAVASLVDGRTDSRQGPDQR